MLSRLSLTLAGRIWALLLALTVLAHATVPFEAPLQARTGSAFSAATVDLAVAPERKAPVQRAMVPVTPPRPVVALALSPPVIERAAPLWPPQTAPPAPAPLLLRPAPRAPPLT